MSTTDNTISCLKEKFNYLKEYLDSLINDEDELESFWKEKLDEVCLQISNIQSNPDTHEKEAELKALEIKKSALEDMISEVSNNKITDKSSGVGSTETLLEALTNPSVDNMLQGRIGGKN